MATLEMEAIVKRWLDWRIIPDAPAHYPPKRSRRIAYSYSSDTLYSYGTHFPLVTILRRRGKVRGFLLNGDTWGGGGWSLTSAHQSAVLTEVAKYAEKLEVPVVTIPASVLDAAGIEHGSVELVHRTDDTWERREEIFDELPERVAEWRYETKTLPGTNVWVHRDTGETLERGWDGGRYRSEPPGRPAYRYGEDWAAHDAALQKWESEWITYPARSQRTGFRYLALKRYKELARNESVELVDIDGEVKYRHSWERHWLGEALIKGTLPYTRQVKCGQCAGTGKVKPYPIELSRSSGEGPLTRAQAEQHDRWHQRRIERWHEDEAEITAGNLRGYYQVLKEQGNPFPVDSWSVTPTAHADACNNCVNGRVPRSAKRTAYFISGFDHNEPRRSYFFSELPPKARPKTLDEAYESLKPATVKLAEEMGRTVLRQGDQFFIEMPGLTLRELKKMGGVHHRRGENLVKQIYQPSEHWTPRFQRLINEDCWLNGTTHEASEVVRVGKLTYARGIVRHVPEGRAPDHVRLPLGDRKTWWLNVANLTPRGK